MAKSSIHIKAGSAGNTLHNARENFSHSVVFTDEKNELLNSSKKAFEIYRKELAIRSKAYTDRTKQKLQSKAITHQSAVVNLLQHHTLKDLKPIKEYIEKTFDTKVFQIAIHRDEGKLVSKADGTELYSGQDFFRNPENNKLYYDKDFSKEIDLKKYRIEKNYHAHIEFMGLDSTGAGIKRNYFTKRKLSELQTFVAQSLSMERGVNRFAKKEKSKKRFDPVTDKAISSQNQKNQRELKLTATKLKNEIENYRKELAAKNKELKLFKQSDYADISALKKALKKSNVEEIYQEFLELKKENEKREEELKKVLAEKEELRKELEKKEQEELKNIKELAELREKLEVQKIVTEMRERENSDLKQDINTTTVAIEMQKTVITALEEEKGDLEQQVKNVQEVLETQKTATVEELAELQKTIDTQNATISTLKAKNSDLEQQLRSAEGTIDTQNATISSLRKEKSELEQQVSETQKVEQSYNFINSKNDELQEQLRNAENTIEMQNATISTLKAENSDLKAKYREIRDAFTEIAQAIGIKFNSVKQVAADIVSKFKSTKEEVVKEPEPEPVSEDLDEIQRKYQQMVENAYKEQQQNKYPKLK